MKKQLVLFAQEDLKIQSYVLYTRVTEECEVLTGHARHHGSEELLISCWKLKILRMPSEIRQAKSHTLQQLDSGYWWFMRMGKHTKISLLFVVPKSHPRWPYRSKGNRTLETRLHFMGLAPALLGQGCAVVGCLSSTWMMHIQPSKGTILKPFLFLTLKTTRYICVQNAPTMNTEKKYVWIYFWQGNSVLKAVKAFCY